MITTILPIHKLRHRGIKDLAHVCAVLEVGFKPRQLVSRCSSHYTMPPLVRNTKYWMVVNPSERQ